MVDGYTYSQMRDTNNYYCSKKNAGCRARVKISGDSKLLNVSSAPHTHSKPNYMITSGGRYIKI